MGSTRQGIGARTAAALVALSFIVGACGGGASPSAPATASPGATAPATVSPTEVASPSAAAKDIRLTLGMALLQGCPFCVSVGKGAQAAAEELGVKVDITEPPTPDTAGQVKQLNALLANPPDMLLLQPWDSVALQAPVKALKDEGVPSIMVDTDVDDPSLRLGVITSNNYDGGVLAANELAKLVGENGKVAAITLNPGASTTDQRLKGFEDTIKSYPDIEYLGAQFTEDDQAKAAAKMSALLVAHPDLAGVFATAESQSIGTATAVSQSDAAGKLKVIAFDGSPAEVQALRDGKFNMLIVQKAYEMGYDAVKQAVDYLRNGTAVPAVTNPDYVIVTKDNVDSPDVSKYLYPES
jgi:ribose transport system substrate-binding protein